MDGRTSPIAWQNGLLSAAVAAAKLINLSGGIDNLLFAGIKRVAIGANVDMKFVRMVGGASLESVTTCAGYRDHVVFGMYICLHGMTLDCLYSQFRILMLKNLRVPTRARIILMLLGLGKRQRGYHAQP